VGGSLMLAWNGSGELKRSAQQRLHLLGWRAPLEGVSGAAVELGRDLVKLDLAPRSQVALARQVLAQEPAGATSFSDHATRNDDRVAPTG
jgi:hypothetical protein